MTKVKAKPKPMPQGGRQFGNDGPDPVLARIAALKTATTPDLKAQWRDLFQAEPPRYNRRFLESRLAYRIQELAYGGLSAETVRRLEKLGEEIEQERLKGGRGRGRKSPLDNRPIAGTKLIRDWKGVEHTVTVGQDCFEWQGRPYKTLSGIANAITGTRWNGLVFFGLKNQKQPRARA